MYIDLSAYHFVSVHKYTNTDVTCIIKNEDTERLMLFCISHDNIIDYYADLGVDMSRITPSIIHSDDIEDIASDLFITLKESDEPINGLYVTEMPPRRRIFNSHEIDLL